MTDAPSRIHVPLPDVADTAAVRMVLRAMQKHVEQENRETPPDTFTRPTKRHTPWLEGKPPGFLNQAHDRNLTGDRPDKKVRASSVRTCVLLPAYMIEQLNCVARKYGVSRSAVVRYACQQFLKEAETPNRVF